VQLLGPQTETAPEEGVAPAEQRNPWIGLGLYNQANAAMLTVQDVSVLAELDSAGLSDTFTATQGSGLPTVTFAVTADTQTQASQTAAELFNRYEAGVNRLQ